MRLLEQAIPTQPAVPIIEVPIPHPGQPIIGDSYALLIPIAVSGVIAIATLAVVPIIKALGEIKKQNIDIKNEAIAIHKVVNSNFDKQTAELKAANAKIESLIAAAENNDIRFRDLTDIIRALHHIDEKPNNKSLDTKKK